MLGGQEEEEEEGEVGRCVTDELDEGLADEKPKGVLGHGHVAQREEGEEQADEDARDRLPHPVLLPPTRELVIPAGRQELLAVGLGHKLNKRSGQKTTQIISVYWV